MGEEGDVGAGPPASRMARITVGMDELRRKYGRGAVVPASLLGRERAAGRDGFDGEGRPG